MKNLFKKKNKEIITSCHKCDVIVNNIREQKDLIILREIIKELNNDYDTKYIIYEDDGKLKLNHKNHGIIRDIKKYGYGNCTMDNDGVITLGEWTGYNPTYICLIENEYGILSKDKKKILYFNHETNSHQLIDNLNDYTVMDSNDFNIECLCFNNIKIGGIFMDDKENFFIKINEKQYAELNKQNLVDINTMDDKYGGTNYCGTVFFTGRKLFFVLKKYNNLKTK